MALLLFSILQYEQNDSVGCPSHGDSFPGADGTTALDACCICQPGQNDSANNGSSDNQQIVSGDTAETGCSLVEGWSKFILLVADYLDCYY